MNFKLIVFIALLTGSLYSFAQESQMSVAEIASFNKILKETAEMKSLQADFTQFKKLGFVDKEIISSGKIYIVHPVKMSWVYTSPTNYAMIFKNNKIYINDQGKKNTIDVGNNKQFEKISKLMASGFSGDLSSSKEYTVSYFKTSTHNLVYVKPNGKDVQQYIQQIILSFDKKDHQISSLKLLEKGGNFTRFELKNKKINATINDQVFAH